MGETGKRFRRDENENKNQKRRTERDEKGEAELVVYRILCPANVIGSVIGKSGKNINSIRQNTGAKVKVVDPFPGANDRVILVYCYVRNKEDLDEDEEFNYKRPLCAAQDALLKMHETITNSIASSRESDSKHRERQVCQLLVPMSQSSNVIGKSGVIIKKLRSVTGANIKVTAKNASDPSHSCALEFDNFVMIAGESEAVQKAIYAVSAIIYKFAPREEIPLDTTVPGMPPSIIIPSDAPMYPAGIYPGVDPIVPTGPVPSVLGSHLQEFPGYVDARSTWPVYSSALPTVLDKPNASRTEELKIRLLCPSHNIGRVIGKGGNSIKTIRQSTGAQIEIDDVKAEECIITVISKESIDDLKSMAVEAVLFLQGKINDEDEDRVTLCLLVPSLVIGCLIGKRGSIINEIRKRTNADVRISKGNKPKAADQSDELVEVIGEVSNVRDALIQILLRLRDEVLKVKEGGHKSSVSADVLHTRGAPLPPPSVMPTLPSIPQVAPLRYERSTDNRSGVGIYSSNGTYGHDFLPKVGEYGDNSHGMLSSYSPKLYSRKPQSSALEVLIPAHSLGKVMGRRGTNLENIQNISGASIEIIDSKSSRGDNIALVSGTPDQKRAAENLIQAFILAT